jgi:hypothetical protein
MPETLKKSRKGIGGPKTAEGKKRCSMNAIRHGLLSAAVVLANEDPDEFEHFRRSYIETFEPVGFLELEILDDMVLAKWRLRRIITTQTAAIDDEADRLRIEEQRKIAGLDEPTITHRAISNLEKASNELSNSNRYEMRYHRMYYRALSKLEQLQDRRKAGNPVGKKDLSDPLPEPASNFPNKLAVAPVPGLRSSAPENISSELSKPSASGSVLSMKGQKPEWT